MYPVSADVVAFAALVAIALAFGVVTGLTTRALDR
jgi:hypothetical protein